MNSAEPLQLGLSQGLSGEEMDGRRRLSADQVRRTIVLVLFTLTPLWCTPQRAPTATVLIHGGFVKARDFLDMDQVAQKVYSMGVIDGMYMAPMFGAPDKGQRLVSFQECIKGMKASQVAAIIEKHIKNNPEHWHWDAKDEVYSAMLIACRADQPQVPQ
jgi:hypothetical protein